VGGGVHIKIDFTLHSSSLTLHSSFSSCYARAGTATAETWKCIQEYKCDEFTYDCESPLPTLALPPLSSSPLLSSPTHPSPPSPPHLLGFVEERTGPTAAEGECTLWAGHSHADEIADVYAGMCVCALVPKSIGYARTHKFHPPV
jgi:hypothetical protein